MINDYSSYLNPAQRFVVEAKMLETGFSCVLQLPTGTGKTWLARLAIKNVLQKGFRAIYVTPLRSLADELHPVWKDDFAPYKVGIFTGDYAKDGKKYPVPFSEADLSIMTPERLDACTRNWRSHWSWIPEVALIVLDEVHLLGDLRRGPRLEGAISRIRRMNPFARFLCLSATLGNREQLAEWLEGIEYENPWRPVPLTWRVARYRKADEKPDILTQEVSKNIEKGGKSLVFTQSRRRCEILSSFLKSRGIRSSYHHAGLSHRKRRSVEDRFRKLETDVLIATGTLEMGLNMPARQVVIYDTQFFDGSRFSPLSVNTVWQRAGRAGRPGLDENGEVVLLLACWDKSSVHYPSGKFENIASNLNDDSALAEQIIAEIGSGLCRTHTQLNRALNHSLASFQGKTMPIHKMVVEMISAGMLKCIEKDTEKNIGQARLSATALGKIITRRLLTPSTVIAVREFLNLFPEFTYFDILFTLALTPDFEPVVPVDFEELSTLALMLDGTPSFVVPQLSSLRDIFEDPTGKRILSAVKTASMMLFWCENDDAETVAEEFSVYPFELFRIRETLDRLLSAAVAISHNVLSKENETDDGDAAQKNETTVRLELVRHMVVASIPPKTAELAFVKGIGPKWAKKLMLHGIRNIKELAASTSDDVKEIKGLSAKRADTWISEAKELSKTRFYRPDNAAPVIDCWSVPNIPENGDPYRTRRAMELTVKQKTEGKFIVSGGLEPHRIQTEKNGWSCDCMDFKKGNLCKHIIAVGWHVSESELVSKKKRESSRIQNDLDLYDLWLER